MRGIAQELRDELQWLCGKVDEAFRESDQLFAPRGRVPAGHVISMLTREALGHLVGAASPVRPGENRPRLVIESRGQDWITASLVGIGSVRLRKRPAKVTVTHPLLAGADEAAPALFEQPPLEAADDAAPALFGTDASVLVLFWDPDMSAGMLQSMWLSEVATLDWGSGGPVIFDEVVFELAGAARSSLEGAGRDEDELGDLLSRWDEGGDSDGTGQFPTPGTEHDEDDDYDGGTAVEDAG